MDYKPSTEAWVKLPVELLKRQGISKATAVTLAAIIDKCKHQATLSAPIDATELTQRTGYSRRTLFRALDELKALALIEINRTGRASMYTLTPGCIELCPKAVKDDHPQTFPQTKRKSRNIPQDDDSMTPDSAYMARVNKSLLEVEDALEGQMEFPQC